MDPIVTISQKPLDPYLGYLRILIYIMTRATLSSITFLILNYSAHQLSVIPNVYQINQAIFPDSDPCTEKLTLTNP